MNIPAGNSASHYDSYKGLFSCPACSSELLFGQTIECTACGRTYSQTNGIPQLFWPHTDVGREKDVTETVKAFYEENPFPNYQNIDSKYTFIQQAERGIFASLLNDQLPAGTKVLEVGCGTGQLTNYLGIHGGRVAFGADLCLNSLKLAQEFKKTNDIHHANFVQMNLFKPAFRPESFHVVICNGVLHHTSDPYGGFRSIAKLVKKGGYIIIGLYNTYGRIPTDIRRKIFNLTGNRFTFLDPRLRQRNLEDLKKHIWFMDQYKHPHESKHTIGEVLQWFDESGFSFVNSIPKTQASASFSPKEKLFKTNPRGSLLDYAIVQTRLMLRHDSEGGFFIMIGRKN